MMHSSSVDASNSFQTLNLLRKRRRMTKEVRAGVQFQKSRQICKLDQWHLKSDKITILTVFDSLSRKLPALKVTLESVHWQKLIKLIKEFHRQQARVRNQIVKALLRKQVRLERETSYNLML